MTSRAAPGLLQRLRVLGRTLDRDRLRAASHALRRGGLRVLIAQVMLHTTHRWRVAEDASGPAVPAQPWAEPLWPADQPLVEIVAPGDAIGAQTLRGAGMIARGADAAGARYLCVSASPAKLAPTCLEQALFLLEAGGYAAIALPGAGELRRVDGGGAAEGATRALDAPPDAPHRRAAAGPTNLLARAPEAGAEHTVLLVVPFLVLGGAERLLSTILVGLCARGFRAIVVTTVPAAPELGDTESWFAAATEEIHHLPRFLATGEYADFVTYLIAAKHVGTLWIAGSAWAYAALPGLRARFPALRVVDLLFNTVGHGAANRSHAARIDLTLVENGEVRRWLLAAGETEARVRLIPSGVDLAHFAPAARSRRMAETLGIGPGCVIAGFAGRLSEEKAPLAMLAIARWLRADPRLRVVIAGTGPMEPALRRAAARVRPAGRVHVLGMVPELRDWLGSFDVLVLPSVLDGRPTVVLEALAMGIPVVASAVGGVPELVREGETGFLCRPGDNAGFARAVGRLAGDPGLRARMGAAGRRFAERELGVARMVGGYAAALAEAPSPGPLRGAPRNRQGNGSGRAWTATLP